MRILHFTAGMGLVGAIVLGADATPGQDYPNKPIRVATGGVGGNNDFSARIIAQALATNSGWNLIIVNYASGFAPAQAVSQAPPDGYTLLLSGSSFGFGHLLTKTPPPYDVDKDFLPITVTNMAPALLVVHPSLPVKTVKELIALARARPGELNYGAGASGSSSHLAAEIFKDMARVKIQGIPYTVASVRLVDLLGGALQMEFATLGYVTPHVKSGRLRALALTSAKPSALMPGIPTVAAMGLPGYEFVGMTGMFAPAKTAPAIIDRINREISKIVQLPGVKQKFLESGVEPVGSSSQEYATKLKLERSRVAKVIEAGGIRVE